MYNTGSSYPPGLGHKYDGMLSSPLCDISPVMRVYTAYATVNFHSAAAHTLDKQMANYLEQTAELLADGYEQREHVVGTQLVSIFIKRTFEYTPDDQAKIDAAEQESLAKLAERLKVFSGMQGGLDANSIPYYGAGDKPNE